MSKMIQIRNVPDSIHRTMKSRAALAGMSLSDYLLRELRRLAGRPSPEEFLIHLQSREPIEYETNIVDLLERERAER